MFDQSYTKQPSEQETISVSWASRIASIPIAGYVIAAVAVTIADASGSDVTSTMLVGEPTASGSNIYLTVAGGADGEDYSVRFLVTLTLAGQPDQVQEDDLRVEVREAVAAGLGSYTTFSDFLDLDLDRVFFNPAEFAKQATYTHGGISIVVPGIFDDDYVDSQGVETTGPVFLCKASIVQGARHNDTLAIGAVTYYIAGVQPAGDTTVLALSKDPVAVPVTIVET